MVRDCPSDGSGGGGRGYYGDGGGIGYDSDDCEGCGQGGGSFYNCGEQGHFLRGTSRCFVVQSSTKCPTNNAFVNKEMCSLDSKKRFVGRDRKSLEHGNIKCIAFDCQGTLLANGYATRIINKRSSVIDVMVHSISIREELWLENICLRFPA